MTGFQKFWNELQRRHVLRVIIPYVVVSLFILVAAEMIFGYFGLDEWALNTTAIILTILFPVALLLAWNYEMSPDGFIRTVSEKSKSNPYKPRQKKPMTGPFIIVFWIVLLLLLLLVSNL